MFQVQRTKLLTTQNNSAWKSAITQDIFMLSELKIIKVWRKESKRSECNQKNQANLTSKRSNFQPLRAYQINPQPLSLPEILSKNQFFLSKIRESNKESNNKKKNNNKKSKCNKPGFYKRRKKGNKS